MEYNPIWKDTFYSASTAVLQYTIDCGGNTIFAGKAYRMPNETVLKINISKICQDYLSQDINELFISNTAHTRNYNACLDFNLMSGSTLLNSYRFLYDWDYDHNWGGTATTLSYPINGHYVDGQMKLKTTVDTIANGNVVRTYRSTGNYDKSVCADYVLYYVNARGGWDCFAFEGRCTKTDTITPHYFNRAFNNTTKEFEQGKYISEITTTYKLNTGMLTQEEGDLFAKHLASSNKCYLHNMIDNKIFPVLITDTSVTYKDDEEDIITYEVNVRESQTKIKR